jgi:hypothetical protein
MAFFNPENYVDVQERINRFWSEHPDGAIVTRLMSPPDDFGQCRYEATVYKHKDDQRPSATGYAFELAGGGGANKTSHEENCETSAIGRALANMGYAKNRQDRPSRQEMDKVQRGEELPARTRTTSVNVIPETGEIVDDDEPITGWTQFWDRVEAMGLPRDGKAFVEMTKIDLGADPAFALERVLAWRKDNAVQKAAL